MQERDLARFEQCSEVIRVIDLIARDRLQLAQPLIAVPRVDRTLLNRRTVVGTIEDRLVLNSISRRFKKTGRGVQPSLESTQLPGFGLVGQIAGSFAAKIRRRCKAIDDRVEAECREQSAGVALLGHIPLDIHKVGSFGLAVGLELKPTVIVTLLGLQLQRKWHERTRHPPLVDDASTQYRLEPDIT